MSLLQSMLKGGFFPKELPPPFTTAAFARAIRNEKTLPSQFTDPKFKAALGSYNLARSGTLRRQLGLVNPVAFYQLADVIAQNWSDIDSHCGKSKYSCTRPIEPKRRVRALSPECEFRDFPLKKALMRGATRFLVRADIEGCYRTIYTHSIPWAFHSKAVAKKNRGSGLFGNEVDRAARNCQDQQTIGIPIGPDTSLVIAESVLTAVDLEFERRHPKARLHRYMDDYEVPAFSRAEADEYLASLQEILAEFQLSLNPKKTRVVELPDALTPNWVRDLRRFRISPSPRKQALSLMDFMDYAFEASRENPDGHVMRFALGRLLHHEVDSQNWPLLQGLLAQAVTAEAGCLYQVYEISESMGQKGCPLNADLSLEIAEQIITRHAPMGHASEVAWALWTIIQSRLKVGSTATKALSQIDDSVVALLTLDADERGLLTGFVPSRKWTEVLSSDGLTGPHWLLAYEASLKGWLSTGADYVAANPAFGFLKKQNVSFYGLINVPAPVPHSTRRTLVRMMKPTKSKRSSKVLSSSRTADSWELPMLYF